MTQFGPLQPGMPREKPLYEILEDITSKLSKEQAERDEENKEVIKGELDPVRDLLKGQIDLTKSEMMRARSSQNIADRIAAENANEEKIARKNLNERLMDVLGGIRDGFKDLIDKVKRVEAPNVLLTAGAGAAFLLLQNIIPPRLVGLLLARRLPLLVDVILKGIARVFRGARPFAGILAKLKPALKPITTILDVITVGLTRVVGPFFKTVGTIGPRIFEAFGKLAKTIPLLTKTVGVIGKFIPFVNVVFGFFSSIFGAFKGLSEASERDDITGLQGAILGAIAGFVEFLTFGLFDFEELFEPLIEIWNEFSENGFLAGVKMLFSKVISGVREKAIMIWEVTSAWLSEKMPAIMDFVGVIFGHLIDFVTSIPPKFASMLGNLGIFLMEKLLGALGMSTEPGTVGGAIMGFATTIKDFLVDTLQTVWDGIRSILKGIGGLVGKAVRKIFNIDDGDNSKEFAKENERRQQSVRDVSGKLNSASETIAREYGISVSEAQDLMFGKNNENAQMLQAFSNKVEDDKAFLEAVFTLFEQSKQQAAQMQQNLTTVQVNNAGAQTTYLAPTMHNNPDPSFQQNNQGNR